MCYETGGEGMHSAESSKKQTPRWNHMYKDSLEEIPMKHKREEEQKSERALDHEADLTPA